MALRVARGSSLPSVAIDAASHVLREFTLDDLPLVEEATRDDFIPTITTVPSTWTPAAGEAFIERQWARRTDGDGWSFAIATRTDNRAVGQIGLWVAHLRAGRAEIGYWVAPSARGRGAASDALAALRDWAFDTLDIDRLSLFIEPWNEASIRTAASAGFEREAVLKNWERFGGVARDMWSFVRTRSDQQR